MYSYTDTAIDVTTAHITLGIYTIYNNAVNRKVNSHIDHTLTHDVSS